jgi:hypothetical protein
MTRTVDCIADMKHYGVPDTFPFSNTPPNVAMHIVGFVGVAVIPTT